MGRQGLWHANPALVMLLGLCPLLAVSNSLLNGTALAIATLITLCISNTSVALLRSHLISTVRIPMVVLIIAGTVTIIEQLISAYLPGLHRSLGIFLPLIVTNCLILGRAEVYARHHRVSDSLFDALTMGVGFALVLMLLGAIRELVGTGSLLGDANRLLGVSTDHWTIHVFDVNNGLLIALLPPGAFITLGLLLALKNVIDGTAK